MIRPVIPIVTALCWLAFGYKLYDLYRHPRDGALRAVCFALAALGGSLTAQVAAADVDRWSGTPNLGRVISNGAALAAACGAQVFLVHVTRGAGDTRTAVRRRYGVLAVCLVLIAVLFALTRPDPRSSAASPQHFQTVYNSPYVWVYLAYLAITLTDVTRLSWRFAALCASLSLRLGLRTAAAAGACGMAYALVRGVFLAGVELDLHFPEWEAVTAGPLYLLTAALTLLGIVIPSLGGALAAGRDHVRRHRSLLRLRPLWQALHTAFPDIALLPPASAVADLVDPRDLKLRLYRRVVEIRDGELALRPYLTPALTDAATRHGRSAGLTGLSLEAVIQAATIAAALAARARGEAAATGGAPVPARSYAADLAAETAWLEKVSGAFARSPVVAALAAGPSGRAVAHGGLDGHGEVTCSARR